MLKLSSELVVKTTGRVQQHASTVILETARCASAPDSTDELVPSCDGSETAREPGCATAGLDEVNVLLDGLQSASVALREVCIQVSNTERVLSVLILVVVTTTTS